MFVDCICKARKSTSPALNPVNAPSLWAWRCRRIARQILQNTREPALFLEIGDPFECKHAEEGSVPNISCFDVFCSSRLAKNESPTRPGKPPLPSWLMFPWRQMDFIPICLPGRGRRHRARKLLALVDGWGGGESSGLEKTAKDPIAN